MKDMQDKIHQAVQYFLEYDSALLQISAHEQSISHRVAVYLEQIFEAENLNVDCEYNKHLDSQKAVDLYDLDPALCRACGCNSCDIVVAANREVMSNRRFRPDILLHSRGTDERNLIAVEIKKLKECPFDDAKLKALTKLRTDDGEYGYELGVFIWFIENKPQYKWFVAGQQTANRDTLIKGSHD